MGRLSDILQEADASREEDCTPCRIAAGLGIARNLCEEFKELDCREIAAMIDNPQGYTLNDVEKAMQRLLKGAYGKPRELLDHTLCLMKGDCPPR